jgi:hypothetical protein
MRLKEYYNLLTKVINHTRVEETAYAFCTVFDKEGWKYCLRVRDGDNERKIIQVFFWSDQQRLAARRFTSSTILVVDATFRINNRGIPLMIGVGKSNIEKTFPAAFSWCLEEDAESYAFFFDCLRKEIY